MSKKFPLYPALTEQGENESQKIIEQFKAKLKKVADEVIGDFYCDVLPYVESDSWINFRNEMMEGFKDYDNRKIQGEYDFKELRQSILKHHKKDIVADLNQDMIKEIEALNRQIKYFQDRSY